MNHIGEEISIRKFEMPDGSILILEGEMSTKSSSAFIEDLRKIKNRLDSQKMNREIG